MDNANVEMALVDHIKHKTQKYLHLLESHWAQSNAYWPYNVVVLGCTLVAVLLFFAYSGSKYTGLEKKKQQKRKNKPKSGKSSSSAQQEPNKGSTNLKAKTQNKEQLTKAKGGGKFTGGVSQSGTESNSSENEEIENTKSYRTRKNDLTKSHHTNEDASKHGKSTHQNESQGSTQAENHEESGWQVVTHRKGKKPTLAKKNQVP